MVAKIKVVGFYRIRMGSNGQLPIGWPEGMLTALTKEELESLDKNPVLRECFERVELDHVVATSEEAGKK